MSPTKQQGFGPVAEDGQDRYDRLIAEQPDVDERVPLAQASLVGARRDGTAGVETSSGLILTIMGEFMTPHGGEAWTQTLLELLGLLGIKDKAGRQALSRAHSRDWLARTRVGRQTRWSLTDEARIMLGTGAERIYGFGRRIRTWDDRWLVLLASVPERDRNLRYRMNTGLSWDGFGSLGQGIWISPWLERESGAVELLTGLGVDATSFQAELGQLGSGPELARRAWDLPTLRQRYDGFLADTAPIMADHPTGPAAAAELAALVHRWRRFPFIDPDLPTALLPDDWPGAAAAERFTELRRILLPEAGSWWQEREKLHTVD